MKLSRRTCLRGLGGVSLALPTLDAMLNGNGTALADGAALPHRYVVCFGGYSLGSGDGDYGQSLFYPSQTGPQYELTPPLKPFGNTFGSNKPPIRDEISVVTGLGIPNGPPNDFSKVPPGGKPANHHGHMQSPLFTGVRTFNQYGYNTVYGPSSDQIVADANRGGATFPSLQFAIQASSYGGTGVTGISVRRDASGNHPFLAPQFQPSQAWRKLFSDFTPPSENDPETLKQFARLKAQRKSVLDLVLMPGRRQKLLARVSKRDGTLLEQHFEHIRAFETALASWKPSANCTSLPAPQDPPVGDNYANPETPGTDEGYSNEELRATLFMQLTHMALACNRTNVVSVQFSAPQSDLNTYRLLQKVDPAGSHLVTGVHGLTHQFHPRNQEELALGIAWHLGHFATLVAKMRDTQEGAANMLSTSALMFLNEGGWGIDYESGGTKKNAHSTQDMAVVIAGRGGGLRPGQHIRFKNDRHPAEVLISGMNAVGVKTDQLGEVTGGISELFA